MPDDKAGFEIDGRFYSWPESYTLGDSVLVRTVSGLDMEEFAELLGEASDDKAVEDSDSRSDPRLLIAMVAVAAWREHRRWSVDRVAQFVNGVNFERFNIHAGDAGEDDAEVPPVSGAGESESVSEPEASSPEPAETSNDEPGSGSDEPIPSPSGSLA